MWSSTTSFLQIHHIPLSSPPKSQTLARVSALRSATLFSQPHDPSNLFTTRCFEVELNQAATSPSSQIPLQISTAADVVREFYYGINRRDLASVERLIADGCVYEDLVFSHPFVGRKAILGFFKKFTESISEDLQFVIDDISNEDTSAVGVTWHLEWQGKPFPFSKGCSFYRLELSDGIRQIIYGRDCVEPATKPGEAALVIIRSLTWLLQRFPQLADRL